jgi:hypothetical protein
MARRLVSGDHPRLERGADGNAHEKGLSGAKINEEVGSWGKLPEEKCETEMSVWIRRLDGQIALPLIAAINRNIRKLPINERSRDPRDGGD